MKSEGFYGTIVTAILIFCEEDIMKNKIELPEKAWVYLPVGFAVGLLLGILIGALVSPHHNSLKLSLFSGNGCGNRDNSASFGSGKKKKKKSV